LLDDQNAHHNDYQHNIPKQFFEKVHNTGIGEPEDINQTSGTPSRHLIAIFLNTHRRQSFQIFFT
jgi:hypothetical protein